MNRRHGGDVGEVPANGRSGVCGYREGEGEGEKQSVLNRRKSQGRLAEGVTHRLGFTAAQYASLLRPTRFAPAGYRYRLSQQSRHRKINKLYALLVNGKLKLREALLGPIGQVEGHTGPFSIGLYVDLKLRKL